MQDGSSTSATKQSSAEILLQKMLETTEHERSRRSLTGLWNALMAMQAANVPDYSIARVGAFSEQHGGPKAQSIRNANGARFRSLIEAFAKEVNAPARKELRRPQNNVDRAIDDIRDLGVRTAIRMAIERSRRLERENDQLRSAFKNLSLPSSSSRINNEMHTDTQLLPLNNLEYFPELSPLDLGAIEKFTSEAWIEARFWSVGNDGSILDEISRSMLIAPPGFMDALRQILKLHKEKHC